MSVRIIRGSSMFIYSVPFTFRHLCFETLKEVPSLGCVCSIDNADLNFYIVFLADRMELLRNEFHGCTAIVFPPSKLRKLIFKGMPVDFLLEKI